MINDAASYISVDRVVLAQQCNKCISKIMELRAKEDEKWLQDETERRNWWRKLFFMRPLSVEEVTNIFKYRLQQNNLPIFFPYPTTAYWGSLNIANKLLNVTKDLQGPGFDGKVLVSVDEWTSIR